MKRRNLILLLGGASSGAMSVGTGAFSSVEAERGVEVNVVEDEEAYLGLDDDAGENLVRITNQFTGDLTLTVAAALESKSGEIEVEADEDDDNIEIEVESGGEETDDKSPVTDSVEVTIPTGNSTDVIAECDGSGSLDLKLSFVGEITDTGTTVNKTREFSVECESEGRGRGVTGVTFESGNSGITINAHDETNRDATVYYEGSENSGLKKLNGEDKSVNEVLQLKQDFDGSNNGREIVGVAIDEIDGVFVHPDFEEDECKIPENGGGSVEVTETSNGETLDDCVG